ncbi:importin subunit alpha-1-like [Trifolium medium]|uniref:Importin subunit alpha-1-like n=1 Tax=Trifolium medium TaxID=97028 RepID=A0A392NPP4_9FABA|nr:importin subunit alpha-1-like [Trifolium medium]
MVRSDDNIQQLEATIQFRKLLLIVPIFAKLLSSPSHDVREQAVCALGNILGDSPTCLSHGALIPLLSQLNEQAMPSMP